MDIFNKARLNAEINANKALGQMIRKLEEENNRLKTDSESFQLAKSFITGITDNTDNTDITDITDITDRKFTMESIGIDKNKLHTFILKSNDSQYIQLYAINMFTAQSAKSLHRIPFIEYFINDSKLIIHEFHTYDCEGLGYGRLLINEVIAIAKDPNNHIDTISGDISAADAQTASARKHRNKCYEHYGFTVTETDPFGNGSIHMNINHSKN